MSTCPRDPGLDLHQLRGLLTPRHTANLVAAITDHLTTHTGFVAFSGGKDSLTVLHLTRQANPDVPVCFYDSHFEFPETYDYIADLTDAWNLNLTVIPARHSTLDILTANTTWDHNAPPPTQRVPDLFTTLIAEPAAAAHARFGPGLLWGLRSQESAGRRAMFGRHRHTSTTGGVVHRSDGTTSFSPIWDWTGDHIWAHISRHNLPINPLYAKLERLGMPPHLTRVCEVLDATNLERGRLVWLKRGWPSLFEQLADALPRITEYA